MDRTYRHLLALQSVMAVANSMAAVFAILFLVGQEGFTDREAVFLNLLAFAISAVGCVVATRARPRSARILMVLGLAALAASYGAYLVLHGWPLLLFVAVTWGVYVPLFFLPFNALVIGITRPEDRARKIGSFVLAYTVVGIAGPSLGGAIVDRFGYPPLFAVAVVVLLADIALLVLLREGREPFGFSLDLRRLGRRTSVALFAEGGFEGMAFGVIPLIAYAFTTEELDLGGLFSLFALAGGIVSVLLGTASDRLRHRTPFLVFGAAASALACLLVVSARTLGGFAFGNSMLSLTASIAPIFLFAIAVERIPGRPASAIVTRELLLNSGRAASLTAFFALLTVGLPVQQAFLLAAACLVFVGVAQSARGR